VALSEARRLVAGGDGGQAHLPCGAGGSERSDLVAARLVVLSGLESRWVWVPGKGEGGSINHP
jgi:hypothetical protein